jgi:hypothetical protein
MILDNLCTPAILYLAFSVTQIVIDIFKNLYNTAFLKFVVMIIFTVLLNLLCKSGLTILSWFIVFIPFIMMTIITTILLFVFGLNPTQGNISNKNIDDDNIDNDYDNYDDTDNYNNDNDDDEDVDDDDYYYKKNE